jgi:hypothetical protein
MQLTHRSFIQSASAAAVTAAIGVAAPAKKLEPGLNAYSFNKLLNDAIRKRGPGITLEGVMDFAAKNKFAAFDPTGYFFPGYPKRPDDGYVDGLKKHAADLGIVLSGTGVRNNFTTADKDVRAEGVAHIKEWVEVAARLGVPVIRVFADTQMRAENWQSVSKNAPRKDVLDWIAADLRECADHDKQYRVKIGVQNHGDFLATADQAIGTHQGGRLGMVRPDCRYRLLQNPRPLCGHRQGGAARRELASPAERVRRRQRDSDGSDQAFKDRAKIRIQRFLPIETLSPQGKPCDPFTVVPAFEAQLPEAIAKAVFCGSVPLATRFLISSN